MSFVLQNQTIENSVVTTIYKIDSGAVPVGGTGPTGPTGPIGSISQPIINSIIPTSGYTIGSTVSVPTNGIYFPNPASGKAGGLDLGSPNAPFANLWVGDVNVSSETIFVGGVPISSDPVTKSIVLPSGSTIGGGDTPGTLVLTAETEGGGGIISCYTDIFNVYTTENTNMPVFKIEESGNTSILSPLFNNTKGSFSIIGTEDGSYLPTSQNSVMVHVTGQPNNPSRIYNDSIGGYSLYAGRRCNGTATSPLTVKSGESIVRFGGNPYIGSNINGGFTSFGTVRMDFVATEDQTVGNQGNEIQFWTTPKGTATNTKTITINSNGITFNSDGTVQKTAGIPVKEKGVPSGVATLDVTGKIPTSQIPPEVQAQIDDLQRQVNILKQQVAEICNLWNTDLFEPHIVNDMLS